MSKFVRNQTDVVSRKDLHRRALDNMTEGCQIIGPDWKYLYVNEAAAAHGNQTKENLLNAKMMDLYPGIEDTEAFGILNR